MEAPASSRCPLRRLSSQAVGCRRPSLSPWLGHRLSGSLWKAWVMAACLRAAASPTAARPCSQPEQNCPFRCISSWGLVKSRDRLAPVGRTPAILNQRRLCLSSRVTPLPHICWESRIKGTERWKDGGEVFAHLFKPLRGISGDTVPFSLENLVP